MRGFMVAMTGDRPQPETFDHSSHTLTSLGPSLDQRIAKDPGLYALQPRFRSLEVGVSTARFHGMVTGMRFPIMGLILRTFRFPIGGSL